MGWLLSQLQNKEESDEHENKMLSRGSPTSESRTKVTKCFALICIPGLARQDDDDQDVVGWCRIQPDRAGI